MESLVIRDADGKVINIGPWEYEYREEDTGLLDSEGRPLRKVVADNPLPEGAYEDYAEVVVGPDGGRYLADDPRAQQ